MCIRGVGDNDDMMIIKLSFETIGGDAGNVYNFHF